MVVSSGREGNGLHRAPPHWSIHKYATDNHSVEGGLLACIYTVNGGGENARDNPDGALVGLRRSKQVRGIN